MDSGRRPCQNDIGAQRDGQDITVSVCVHFVVRKYHLTTDSSTGEIMVTNDGATILKSIALDNAAAKVLVCSTPEIPEQPEC